MNANLIGGSATIYQFQQMDATRSTRKYPAMVSNSQVATAATDNWYHDEGSANSQRVKTAIVPTTPRGLRRQPPKIDQPSASSFSVRPGRMQLPAVRSGDHAASRPCRAQSPFTSPNAALARRRP